MYLRVWGLSAIYLCITSTAYTHRVLYACHKLNHINLHASAVEVDSGITSRPKHGQFVHGTNPFQSGGSTERSKNRGGGSGGINLGEKK